jgi:hypothetical protein
LEVHDLTVVTMHSGEQVARDPSAAPLDALVEAAPVRGRQGWAARLRIAYSWLWVPQNSVPRSVSIRDSRMPYSS